MGKGKETGDKNDHLCASRPTSTAGRFRVRDPETAIAPSAGDAR
jgi:hypothetical protein